MLQSLGSLVLSAVLLPLAAFGMGADHPAGDLPKSEGWLKGVYEIVNKPNRVHGYWINSSDTLFYAGTEAELNESLAKLAGIQGHRIELVLHCVPGIAKSPWSDKVVSNADWSLTVYGERSVTQTQNQLRVDVWLSRSMTLDKLRIPESIAVISGGEIEQFLLDRAKPQVGIKVLSDGTTLELVAIGDQEAVDQLWWDARGKILTDSAWNYTSRDLDRLGLARIIRVFIVKCDPSLESSRVRWSVHPSRRLQLDQVLDQQGNKVEGLVAIVATIDSDQSMAALGVRFGDEHISFEQLPLVVAHPN